MRTLVALSKETARLFGEARVTMLGAAISFYAIFSLAPIAVIAVAVAGLILEDAVVRGYVEAYVARELGAEPARLVSQMIDETARREAGLSATVTGLAVLLYASTRLFIQLQKALNQIWDARPASAKQGLGRKVFRVLEKRMLSFTFVLALGVLLLASVVASTALAAMGAEVDRWVRLPPWVTMAVEISLITILLALAFTVLFKVMPDTKVPWRSALYGGALAAVLFSIGRAGLGMYLGRGAVASSYGAAGALVVVVLWIYYSAQVVFVGAVFSRAHTEHMRRPPPLEPLPRWRFRPPPAWRRRNKGGKPHPP